MFEQTKKICDYLLELGIPGFDLAVFKDGECVLRHMNGYSDLENKIKMQGNEKYYIYSCSKPITCTAALQLYEKGLFCLEDKLSDYMPEFSEMTVQTENGIKKAEKPILIKHLFEMSAGFSYNLVSDNIKKCQEETNGKCPTRELMKYLAKDPLLFEPGERWEYSLCHDVLAAFVEVVSGMPFNDYVTENIFKPLGMNSSTFLPENEKASIATLYRFNTEQNKPVDDGKNNAFILGTEYASGGAGCVSTVDDYIKFLEGLRTYKLLKPETVTLMITDRFGGKSSGWDDNHGYGLGVRCPKGRKGYTDFGWGGAASAYLAVDIEKGLSIYLGMHIISSPAQEIRGKVYEFICSELFGTFDMDEIVKQINITGNYNLTY